jgi:hypothetical protein
MNKQKITDRIKTYQDAQRETNRPDVPYFLDAPEDLREFFQSLYKVIVINEALNEGTKLDIHDISVNRYYPWFFNGMGSPSGFAFRDACYGRSCADAGGGSRLCLKNQELTKYAGLQFKDEYVKFLES